MAYALIDTNPNKTAIKTAAGVQSDPGSIAQTYPYKRSADIPSRQRMIVLRPPALQVVGDDPAMDAIRGELDAIGSNTRLAAAPWIVEPPDAESFHLAAGIPIPAVSPTVFTTVVQIQCPPGRNGVLNRIANIMAGGTFVAFGGQIVWQIVRNPASGITTAERNYQNITASLGNVDNPAKIAGIRLFENDIIALVVRNNSIVPGGEIIGGLLGGYFYPRTWDDQFERQKSSVAW